MRFNTLLPLVLLAASCSGNDKSGGSERADSSSSKSSSAPSAASGVTETCYRRVQGRDTFALRLRRSGNDLSGELGFANYGSDPQQGSVTGKAFGNVYRLIYVYETDEARNSMELFYRVEGSGLLRGVGTMNAGGDTIRYAHPAAVQYPATERWDPVPCDDAK
jgi:hypothetical protein